MTRPGPSAPAPDAPASERRTVPLGRLAKLIRSKNAGPFVLTIDVLFDDPATFRAVADADVLNAAALAPRFGVAAEEVRTYVVPTALALKVSLPRPVPSGALDDGDVFGGQQFAPLVDLPVEIPPDLPLPNEVTA